MAAIPVSLADSEICLPLQDRGIHIHMAIPFPFIEHLDPSIIQFWNGGLPGQGSSPRGKTVELATPHLRHISQQLSRVLFECEKPIRYTVGSCNAEDWEHLRRSDFLWTFFVGAENISNARILIFKATDSLDQGRIHFSVEELGEKERAVWTAGWKNQVKTCEVSDLYSTPLKREMWNKSLFLQDQLEGKVPRSLDEEGSPRSPLPEDRRAAAEHSVTPN